MKLRDCLEKWGLSSLKIKLVFLAGDFTKWHRLSLGSALRDAARCREFRQDLAALQPRPRSYAKALAAMADVEDLTALEPAEQ